MGSVMIVEDQAIIREPIAATLRRAGHQTITATNGHEAMQLLRTCSPDLILLDIAMPVMDGMKFLQALRSLPGGKDTAVIMLTAVSDKHRVVEAARLGISGYMLKSRFSLEELLQQVERTIGCSTIPHVEQSGQVNEEKRGTGEGVTDPMQVGDRRSTIDESSGADRGHASPIATRQSEIVNQLPSSPSPGACSSLPSPSGEADGLRALKPIISRSEIAECIDGCGELKGFSPSVAEVLKLTGNARCSIEQVSKAISRDHAIALKVLKLANSAVYTRGEPVDSVHKAVMRIGLGQIRQTVLNIAVIERFSSAIVEGFIDSGQFWEHAIATGIISAEIAHARDDREADGAFTMGLLHDVGRMVLVTQLGERYRQVLQAARETSGGLPLEQVEHRMLCYNHADIMDRVFRQWKFAKEFINPIVFHHLSAANMRAAAPQEARQVATLALANRLAHAFMLGSSGNETIYPTEDICELMRLDPRVIARIEQIARDETDKVKFALLANSNQPNWSQLRDVHRQSIATPLRPLYVSSSPAIDAYRIFCDQLTAGHDDEDAQAPAPNFGVISFRHVRERVALSEQYRRREAELNIAPPGLPLLIISPAGKVMPEAALLNGRPFECLPAPFAIPRFVAAVNRLRGEQMARAAA